jgi:hypothetical protein
VKQTATAIRKPMINSWRNNATEIKIFCIGALAAQKKPARALFSKLTGSS